MVKCLLHRYKLFLDVLEADGDDSFGYAQSLS